MEQHSLFQPLDTARRSPASIACSLGVHASVTAVLLLAPVAVVHHAIQPKQTLTLIAPKPVEEYKPKPVQLPIIKTKPLLPPALKPVAKIPELKTIEPPKIIPPPVVELPKIVSNLPVPQVAKRVDPAPVRPVVKTEVFPTPSATATNLGPKSAARDIKTDTFGTQAAAAGEKSPNRSVQTGGFGDPHGIAPSQTSKGKGVVMAAFGSPSLPVGAGQVGGGGRQVVGSAGFGGGFASAGPGGNGTVKGAVKSSGFGDTITAAAPLKKEAPASPRETQVEVLSKPKPVYSPEAREMKIEGQVAVEVQFCALGSVKVLRVLKGLGHGLDEAAQQAAAQIRFKPATRDGAAVDSTARVYIVFQLT